MVEISYLLGKMYVTHMAKHSLPFVKPGSATLAGTAKWITPGDRLVLFLPECVSVNLVELSGGVNYYPWLPG